MRWAWGVRIFGAIVASAILMFIPTPARATVTGHCTAELAGVSITTGHDSAGSAVRVDYRDVVEYEGRSSGGGSVTRVTVALEVLDVGVLTSEARSTDGTTWRSTTEIEKYAWAGVGLYHIRGVAFTGPDENVLCTGLAYICVDGKSPLTTVAGAVSAGMGLVAVAMLARGIGLRKRRFRGSMAARMGATGLLAAVPAVVLLQQTCSVPLAPGLTGGIVGGAVLWLAVVGAALGAPKSPTGVLRRKARERTAVVYRFAPGPDACNACRSHAVHRTYRSFDAIVTDRAHPGCTCEILTEPRRQIELVALFTGRGNVHDDREP